KERFCAAELCFDLKARVTGQIRTGLDLERLIVHLDAGDIAGSARGKCHLPRSASSGEGRDESRFTADGAFKSTKDTALHLRMQVDIRGHRYHRACLCRDRLLSLQIYYGQSE